jgi:hypothetical protein
MPRLNQRLGLPFLATQFGSWWGSDVERHEQTDIDIVAHSERGGEVLLAECKWRAESPGIAALEKLLDKRRLLPGYQTYHYYFFSKMPMIEVARQKAAEYGIQCVSLDELFPKR